MKLKFFFLIALVTASVSSFADTTINYKSSIPGIVSLAAAPSQNCQVDPQNKPMKNGDVWHPDLQINCTYEVFVSLDPVCTISDWHTATITHSWTKGFACSVQ